MYGNYPAVSRSSPQIARASRRGTFPNAGAHRRLKNAERQICAPDRRARRRVGRVRASLNGPCVARSTRVEEDALASGAFVGVRW
jgi:hypothetical protein